MTTGTVAKVYEQNDRFHQVKPVLMCALGTIRTYDRWIRSPLLYPAELRGRASQGYKPTRPEGRNLCLVSQQTPSQHIQSRNYRHLAHLISLARHPQSGSKRWFTWKGNSDTDRANRLTLLLSWTSHASQREPNISTPWGLSGHHQSRKGEVKDCHH